MSADLPRMVLKFLPANFVVCRLCSFKIGL